MDDYRSKDTIMERPSFEELHKRISSAKAKSSYTDRNACCWQGYLAALLEWDLITPEQHRQLSAEAPTAEPDPSSEIFLK